MMAAVHVVCNYRDMRKYRPSLKYQKRRTRGKTRLVVANVTLGGRHCVWDSVLMHDNPFPILYLKCGRYGWQLVSLD